MTTKRIVWVLILAGMIAMPAATSGAQPAQGAASREQLTDRTASQELSLDISALAGGPHQLEGSWAITVSPVTPPGVVPPPPFRVYGTFSAGGAVIGSDRRSPFGSPQHGTWAHTGGHEFAFTVIQDLFNAVGDFQGTVKVRVAKLIITGEDEFVGVSSAEFRDAALRFLS